MGLVLLPCEIFHREFDAKLLLACRLATKYRHFVLIGWDKHFNLLAKSLPPSVSLDKSCSLIVWNARIKQQFAKGGKIIISDEEGVNNLGQGSRNIFLNRIYPKAARSIGEYSCWGELDKKFFNQISELENKTSIRGNCRSDLLPQMGRNFYKEESNALNHIFGDYILCSDNFSTNSSFSSIKLLSVLISAGFLFLQVFLCFDKLDWCLYDFPHTQSYDVFDIKLLVSISLLCLAVKRCRLKSPFLLQLKLHFSHTNFDVVFEGIFSLYILT